MAAGMRSETPGSGTGVVLASTLSTARKRSELNWRESKVPEKFATPSPLKSPGGTIVPKSLPPTGVPPKNADSERVPLDPATAKSNEIAVKGEEKEMVSGPESLEDPQKF